MPVTLPAQSLPVAQPEETQPRRELPPPAAFIAVVTVSALVIILCVLGAAMSGLFSFVTSSDTGAVETPAANEAKPSALVAGVSFPDGQWLVLRDIQPGTYAVAVPNDSPGCTWERNASTDGTASSVLETGGGSGGEAIVVSIRETDKVFQSMGCGVWQRTAD